LLALVQEIGASAGLAAVVGLVVLSALYVSHARDVKRLREWAGRAPKSSVPSVRRRSRPWYGRIGTRYVAVAVVGLLVLGGAAAYWPDKTKPNRAAVKRGAVTVAVLNGTTVPGLAAALREQIAAAGFKKGKIDVFSDQQLAESVVQYAPGRQAAAKAVSRTVGVSEREPVTADSRALAGDATVIVIAGADKGP
jgi:LytR cell envelope-related transcriptional attenuator